MYPHISQALAAERVRDLHDLAAVARRARQARREQGGTQAAASVVCLHASASSGRQ